ncbi:hypothetical protein G7Y89_g13227 [Cudoniella acicularis]|uniref:INO80 complex subunit B-like conserved region domain-containing protein n=1 Tax=Cudoniella acicularis TaxID=354080 RepID=A0A8H4VWM3_9HELO|nr:hypothetical protein G7Y89_g13227 [Cudoniella acicularis]
MAGRASKKIRRLSTDSEGTEEGYEWVGLKGSSKTEAATPSSNKGKNKAPSRSSRKAAENISSATVSRGATTGSPRGSQSLSLTVKTSSSKLREAIRSSPLAQSVSVGGRDRFAGGEIIEGKRSRNVRKSYVLESDSEDDEDEEMEDVADDDAEGETVEEDDDDIDAEDDGLGDEDAEGDVDMDLPPPPPAIKISKAQSGRQTITAKAPKGDKKTVEQKEVELGSDDEELSELESEIEVEEEEAMQTGNEEDAEGEEEEIEVDEGAEDDEEELDSDDDTPGGGSRGSTPDLNKLTKRQRARLEEGGSGFLMALPDEVQVKKQLTAEEHAMRRAEMARRRKNLSEKRNEEEKAPKTNARRRDFNGMGGDATPDMEGQKPNPLFVRWVSSKDGNRIGVPEEWVEGPVGNMFQNSIKSANGMGGKLIEEVS